MGTDDPAEAFPTILVAQSLATVLVGLAFLLLGLFRLGHVVNYIPKPLLIGAVAGIGVFLLTSGLQVASAVEWKLEWSTIRRFFTMPCLPLTAVAVGLAIFLRVLAQYIQSPLLAPLYFIAIPALFFPVVLVSGVGLSKASDAGWTLGGTPFNDTAAASGGERPAYDPLDLWRLFDFTNVHWDAIWGSTHVLIGLVVFSLAHVPINVPSLSLTSGQKCDINKELLAHGWSNLLSGAVGGVQNYLCYSNSALFYKCGGGEGFPDILREHGKGTGAETIGIVKQKLSRGLAMRGAGKSADVDGGGKLLTPPPSTGVGELDGA